MFKTKKEAAAYLSGLIDGEGSIALDMKKGVKRRRIEITNTDVGIIGAAVEACQLLGVTPTVRQLSSRPLATKPCYGVIIGNRAGFLALEKHLNMASSSKSKKFKEAVESYKGKNRRIPRDEWPLQEVNALLQNGATRSELAKHFNKSDAAIGAWKKAALEEVV